MLEFEVAGVHVGFSLLLVCMMTGTIFCNICDFSEVSGPSALYWRTTISVAAGAVAEAIAPVFYAFFRENSCIFQRSVLY